MEEIKSEEKKSDQRKIWILIASVLLVGLLFQTIYVFQLHKKMDRMNVKAPLAYRETPDVYASSRQPSARPDSFTDANDWDPFYELERMQEQINRMFSHSMRRATLWDPISHEPQTSWFQNQFYEPDLDIEDKKDHYLIRMDIPGLEKDQIEISVTENLLTVSGERKSELVQNQDASGYYRMERCFGSFMRQVPLPSDIKPEQVRAEYKNGVLSISIQKEAASPEQNKTEVHKIAVT